jgi:hypothetical protein
VVTIEVARKQAARVVAEATTAPVKAAITVPAVVRPPKCKTCNAKRRIGRGADKRASASRIFSAAAVIASVAAEAVGADAEAGVAAVAVAKRWHPSMDESLEPKFTATFSRHVTPNHAGIMLPIASIPL